MKSYWVALCVVVLVLYLNSARADTICAPESDIYVCGLINSEDLVRLPETQWVVASHVNIDWAARDSGGLGPLEAARIDTRKVRRLYPTAGSKVNWDRKTFPDCQSPPQEISVIGLNAQPVTENRFRLYAANIGGRDSVEVIDVEVQGQQLQASWRGCIHAPSFLRPNAVAPLPDGGVVLSGKKVGIWRPGRGWKAVEGFAGFSNGAETSRDGRWIFVATPSEKSVIRVPVDGETSPIVIKLGFEPDNLRWGENGRLYVAGPIFPHDPQEEQLRRQKEKCYENTHAICDVGFAVAEIDPRTLQARELMRSEGIKDTFGAATTALQIGDRLWLGTFHGNRAAIVPLRDEGTLAPH